MKNKYSFLLLLGCIPVFSINKNIKNDDQIITRNQLLTNNELVHMKEKPNYYCYKNYEIHEIFFDFVDLVPLYCSEFMLFIIDNYALDAQKAKLKVLFYTLSPEEIWNTLNSSHYFPSRFIGMINAVYTREEFILIYKTRIMIELMVFAFNTQEKSIQYNYSYFHNIELKKILYSLLEFTDKANHLLREKFTAHQVEEFRKFLNKYIAVKSINRMNFLNDLKAFKYFLDIFLKEKEDISLTVFQKIAIMNRFLSVFPK